MSIASLFTRGYAVIPAGLSPPYRLNLGCGARYLPSWVNIDMRATGPGVIAHDLARGIPLPDQSCEVVYHSHVLEHIPRARAVDFLRECHRVLVPGGLLRVAVPDLERICRTYLEKLDLAMRGDAAAAYDYQWIVLELYDQAVRERSGGGMRDYIAAPRLHNPEFILERIGEEGKGLIRALRESPLRGEKAKRSPVTRMRNVPGRVLRLYKSAVTRLLLGKKASEIFAAGTMRFSGEVHQWMYDRYSLRELLLTAGFMEPTLVAAGESRLPGWAALFLDTDASGNAIKPDSLYMEAVRSPAA